MAGNNNWAMISSGTRKQSIRQAGQAAVTKNMPEATGIFVGINTLNFLHEDVIYGKPDSKHQSVNILLFEIELDDHVRRRLNFYGMFGARAQKTGVIPKEWEKVKAIYIRGNIKNRTVDRIKAKFLDLLTKAQPDSSTPGQPLESDPAYQSIPAYLNSSKFPEASWLGKQRNTIFTGTYSDGDLAISETDPEAASLYLRYIEVLFSDEIQPGINNFYPDKIKEVTVRNRKVSTYPVNENDDFGVVLHTTLHFLNNYNWNGNGPEYKNLKMHKGGRDGSDFWTITVASWRSKDLSDTVLAMFPDRIRGLLLRSDRVRMNYVFSYQNQHILDRIINLNKSGQYPNASIMFAGKSTADITTKNMSGNRLRYINPYKSQATGEKIVDINLRQGSFVTIRNRPY